MRGTAAVTGAGAPEHSVVSAGSGGLRTNPAVCRGSATATQHQGAWGAGTGKDRHGMTSLGLGFTAPSCAGAAPTWVSARCQGWSQLCALELWGGGSDRHKSLGALLPLPELPNRCALFMPKKCPGMLHHTPDPKSTDPSGFQKPHICAAPGPYPGTWHRGAEAHEHPAVLL